MRIKSYLRNIGKFSYMEWPSILLYSIASYILGKLPKGLTDTYLVFKELHKRGIKVSLNGENNVISGFEDVSLSILIKRNSSDSRVVQQILIAKEYLPIVTLLSRYNVIPNKIVDAGANIGLTTLYLKSIFPSASIIALEPNKMTFERMVVNLELNQCKEVIPLNIGLWAKDTYLTPDNTFRDGQDWSFSLKMRETDSDQRIEAKCIESLINEYNWNGIDFLKMDIEGAESNIFGADEFVQNWLPKTKVIAIEVHNELNCEERILKILTNNGFKIEYHGELTVGINLNLI